MLREVMCKKMDGRFYVTYDSGRNWHEVPEDTYKVIAADEARIRMENYRAKRCRDENFNRCLKDCAKCDREPSGSNVSLDVFDNERNPQACIESFEDEVIFFADLEDFLSVRDEDTFTLIAGSYRGSTYDELSEELKVSKSTAHDRTVKNLKIFFE